MPEDNRVDELLGQMRVIDTKIAFLEQDLAELKQMIGTLGETSAACFAKLLATQEKNQQSPRRKPEVF